MGIYLNPGNRAFQKTLNLKIYVDKTELIAYTNDVLGTRENYVSVSRPRRFGKSMTAEMLAAYYSRGVDSRDQFKMLKIGKDSSFEQHLNKYNVIFLNMQDFLSRTHDIYKMIELLENVVLRELLKAYPDVDYWDKEDLVGSLQDIYAEHEISFVFIIDEWDCIFREKKDNMGEQRIYLDFLRYLLKDKVYVGLAYMTGILPIKKYGTHSALNMFDEFSMTRSGNLAEFVGFTEDEVQTLCQRFDKDFHEIKRWYDGYLLDRGIHIYNPKSVIDAMESNMLKSFWTNTETYEALQVYVDLNLDGLKEAIMEMLAGGRCKIDTGTFQNDMTSFKSKDDVLTLLVHLGYLAFDESTESVFIPNEEVRGEFVRSIKTGGRPELIKMLQMSDQLIKDTLCMNEEKIAAAIDAVHSADTVPIHYNNEQALRSVIRRAYISCVEDFVELQELPAGKGYADVVYLPKRNSAMPVLLIELKWDKTAEGAIEQIKHRNYPQALAGYGGDILLVGINYDAKMKKHECKIEKIELE